MKQKLKEMQGFTLAELLIVVAIIGILVAISIPVFNSQLEKSRESVDLANLRSAYAECATEVLTVDTAQGTSVMKKVDPKQTKEGWTGKTGNDIPEVAGVSTDETVAKMKKGTPIFVVVDDEGNVIFTTEEPDTGKVKNLDEEQNEDPDADPND